MLAIIPILPFVLPLLSETLGVHGTDLTERAADAPRVTFCVNTNLNPFCGLFAPAEGACQNLGPDLNGVVKSASLGTGTTCVLFSGEGCSGEATFISTSGNLAASSISSFECSGP